MRDLNARQARALGRLLAAGDAVTARDFPKGVGPGTLKELCALSLATVIAAPGESCVYALTAEGLTAIESGRYPTF